MYILVYLATCEKNVGRKARRHNKHDHACTIMYSFVRLHSTIK